MTPIEERVSRLEGGHEHLATKADIAEVHTSIAEVHTSIAQVYTSIAEVHTSIAQVYTSIADVRTSMAELRAELLERIASGENRHIRWTVGTMLVGLSIAVAVIKLID